jgi:hypothetical protein
MRQMSSSTVYLGRAVRLRACLHELVSQIALRYDREAGVKGRLLVAMVNRMRRETSLAFVHHHTRLKKQSFYFIGSNMQDSSNVFAGPSVSPAVRGWPYLRSALAVVAIIAIWLLGRGIVFGTLANHERMTGQYETHQISWASQDVTLALPPDDSSGSVTLVGQATHDQRWTIDCAGVMHASVDIRAGLFRQLVPIPTACESNGVTIHSDWAMVPANGVGSHDTRSLSYQLFAVQSGTDVLPLDALVANSSGLYPVESLEVVSSPQGILTERWDATWYRNIALRGYRFNGDTAVQQNVAWPFLFPMLVKSVASVFHIAVPSAMIRLNAALLLAALLILFAIGRASGLTRSQSLIAPAWLSFNPFAFFVVGGFSEPLFLALECLLVLLLLHKQYGLSAVTVALLGATRFIGLIGFAWIAIMVWRDASISRSGKLWRLAMTGVVSVLGIVTDMVIKASQTGYPLAAFMVRKSWQVTPFSVLKGMLEPFALFSGDYLQVLWLPMALIVYALVVLARTTGHAGMKDVRLLLGVGLTLVAATLVLSPEIHAAGRYFLPFAPAIVGLAAYAPWQRRSLALLLVSTAAGAAFMPFLVARIAMGLPPY